MTGKSAQRPKKHLWFVALSMLTPAALSLASLLVREDASAAAFSAAIGLLSTLVVWFAFQHHHPEQYRQGEALVASRIESERQRIARDLHDGVAAHLTAIAWRTAALRRDARCRAIAGELDALGSRAREAVEETRAVVWALQGHEQTWANLVQHLDRQMHELCAGRIQLVFEVSGMESKQLSAALASDLVRAVTESVRNALHHANARSVRVSLHLADELSAEIVDDGNGFREAEIAGRSGSGLANLRVRAAAHGGEVIFESADPGTRVWLRLPSAV